MTEKPVEIVERCPSCGLELYNQPISTFHRWGTPLVVLIISLMLLGLDLANRNSNGWYYTIDWAHWAIIGIWILYSTVQLLRFNPDYGWLLIPFGGFIFSIYFVFLDYSEGSNTGPLNLDWALNVVIPIATFIIFLPIVARSARKQPSHLQLLTKLIEKKEEEFNAIKKE